jgi:hypothetical protein
MTNRISLDGEEETEGVGSVSCFKRQTTRLSPGLLDATVSLPVEKGPAASSHPGKLGLSPGTPTAHLRILLSASAKRCRSLR